MSNNIFAKEKVEEIHKLWMELAGAVSKNVDVLEQYSKTANNLPSSYLTQVEKIKTNQEQQRLAEIKLQKAREKSFDKLENQLKKEQKARENQLKKESDLRQRLKKMREQQEKADARELANLAKTQGIYNKVQIGINNLTKEYNDLALKKELNGRLTNEETVTLGRLEAKLNKYQKALVNVDSRIGKHGRNVGNYKSGFDGLGFSVAQLTREMPAFANSMQTGFMAISNNIPMLTDEINKLRRANVELASSGKPTVSIFKSLGKAIFSWQSLISLGVTLLTVYGAKIFETIFAVSEEEKALKKANEQYEEQNKNLKENISLRKQQLESAKGFLNQKNLLEDFREALNDLSRDSENTEAVLKELYDRINTLGIEGTDELVNQNILASDRIRIAANLLSIEEKNIELQEERIKNDELAREQAEILKDFKSGEIGELEKNSKLQNLNNISLSRTIDIQKEINRLNQANQEIIGKTIEITTESSDEVNDSKEKEFSSLSKALEFWTKYDERIKKVDESIKNYTGSIEDMIIKHENDLPKIKIETEIEPPKLTPKELDLLNQQFQGLGDVYGIDGAAFTKLFDGKKNTVDDYVNAAAEASKGLYSVFQQNYDNDLRALEKQRDVSLQFVDEGSAAEIDLKEKYAEEEAKIRKKQAKQEKDMAIFDSIINTAAAVVKALPNVPLSIGVGVIGALKTAAIAATPLPEFKDGVTDFDGGFAKINDQKGSNYQEYVRTPDGNMHMFKGRNVVVDIPKGSDVLTATESKKFDDSLSDMLNSDTPLPFESKNYHSPVINVSQGISANEMDRIMSRHFSNIKTSQTIIDKNGLNTYVKGQNSRKQILNNRTSFNGFEV